MENVELPDVSEEFSSEEYSGSSRPKEVLEMRPYPENTDEGHENEDHKEDSDNEMSNAGWADSITKILKTNKPKRKKTLVLSKAKKITDIKQNKTIAAGFQVETVEGEIKEEKIETEEISFQRTGALRIKRKELPSLRVKPNILEKDKERILTKIATKGVVQLFNAVKIQQKDISNKLQEAGPLDARREKVLRNIDKRTFLDVLMGEKSIDVENESKKRKKIEVESNHTWSVLRDDFMMGAKMKDWDKELEENEYENEINTE